MHSGEGLMRLSLLFLFILSFPSLSFAQISECQCLNDPKDCEVGRIQCSFKTTVDGRTFEETLAGKLTSGDDVNPEWGAGVRQEIGPVDCLDMNVFGAACDNRTFSVHFSTIFWKYLPPEYPTLASVDRTVRDIAFDGPPFTETIVSENGLLRLEITCLGESLAKGGL